MGETTAARGARTRPTACDDRLLGRARQDMLAEFRHHFLR
jgi:hypothetical protein